jgi:hypothetical protein
VVGSSIVTQDLGILWLDLHGYKSCNNIVQEEIHTVKSKNKMVMIIKLDLSKVYDKTNWLYRRLMLIHIRMSFDMVNWIWNCLSIISFSIIIHGSASNLFSPSRGLRYGLPLSPFSF